MADRQFSYGPQAYERTTTLTPGHGGIPLPSAAEGRVGVSPFPAAGDHVHPGGAVEVGWDDVTDKPTEFPPDEHDADHADAFAAIGHTHAAPPVQTPTGSIVMWPTATPPTGWLVCDGTAIPAGNTALIALIGANTPDLRDRFPIGASGTKAVGTAGGSATKTLTEANLAAHNHTIPAHTHDIGSRISSASGGAALMQGSVAGTAGTVSTQSTATATNNTGSGTAFDVMNPWRAMNFIIKV